MRRWPRRRRRSASTGNDASKRAYLRDPVQSSTGTGGSPRAVMTYKCSPSKRYRIQTFCPVTRRTNARVGAKRVSPCATPGRRSAFASPPMAANTARYADDPWWTPSDVRVRRNVALSRGTRRARVTLRLRCSAQAAQRSARCSRRARSHPLRCVIHLRDRTRSRSAAN